MLTRRIWVRIWVQKEVFVFFFFFPWKFIGNSGMSYLLCHGVLSHCSVHIGPDVTADGKKVHKAKFNAWQWPVHLRLDYSFLVVDGGPVGTSKSGLGQSETPVASPLACHLMTDRWIA